MNLHLTVSFVTGFGEKEEKNVRLVSLGGGNSSALLLTLVGNISVIPGFVYHPLFYIPPSLIPIPRRWLTGRRVVVYIMTTFLWHGRGKRQKETWMWASWAYMGLAFSCCPFSISILPGACLTVLFLIFFSFLLDWAQTVEHTAYHWTDSRDEPHSCMGKRNE